MNFYFRNKFLSRIGKSCAASVCLWTAWAAFGQQPYLTTILGEVRTGRAVLWNELTVEVRAAGGIGESRAYVRPDGSFEVRDVPVGTQQVWLLNQRGNTLWHEFVLVIPGATRLAINLETTHRPTTREATVSIAALSQKRSPVALKQLRLADKAAASRQIQESIQHLRRALEIVPEMQEARTNLGARLLQSGEYEGAKRELERAISIDREAPAPHIVFALVLLALGHGAEAEAEARVALRRDPLSPGANYAAGAALDRQGRPDDALPFLERAEEKVPQALLIEARILASRHDAAGAALKLRVYLSHRGISQRSEVERWLKALTR